MQVKLQSLYLSSVRLNPRLANACTIVPPWTLLSGESPAVLVNRADFFVISDKWPKYLPSSCLLTGVYDKMLEGIMQSTCAISLNVEQYPRTSIVITVQEMQERGNVWAPS